MINEFGGAVRFDGCVDNGNGSETDKVVADVGTQTDRSVDEVSWESCFIFLFCEKPTPKELLYPRRSVRIKRAVAFAEDCKCKMEVDSYLKING